MTEQQLLELLGGARCPAHHGPVGHDVVGALDGVGVCGPVSRNGVVEQDGSGLVECELRTLDVVGEVGLVEGQESPAGLVGIHGGEDVGRSRDEVGGKCLEGGAAPLVERLPGGPSQEALRANVGHATGACCRADDPIEALGLGASIEDRSQGVRLVPEAVDPILAPFPDECVDPVLHLLVGEGAPGRSPGPLEVVEQLAGHGGEPQAVRQHHVTVDMSGSPAREDSDPGEFEWAGPRVVDDQETIRRAGSTGGAINNHSIGQRVANDAEQVALHDLSGVLVDRARIDPLGEPSQSPAGDRPAEHRTRCVATEHHLGPNCGHDALLCQC